MNNPVDCSVLSPKALLVFILICLTFCYGESASGPFSSNGFPPNLKGGAKITPLARSLRQISDVVRLVKLARDEPSALTELRSCEVVSGGGQFIVNSQFFDGDTGTMKSNPKGGSDEVVVLGTIKVSIDDISKPFEYSYKFQYDMADRPSASMNYEQRQAFSPYYSGKDLVTQCLIRIKQVDPKLGTFTSIPGTYIVDQGALNVLSGLFHGTVTKDQSLKGGNLLLDYAGMSAYATGLSEAEIRSLLSSRSGDDLSVSVRGLIDSIGWDQAQPYLLVELDNPQRAYAVAVGEKSFLQGDSSALRSRYSKYKGAESSIDKYLFKHN